MKPLLLSLVALFLLVAAGRHANSQDEEDTGWLWSNPVPQGNHLRDIAFSDNLNGTAVGDHGSIVRTTDGGASWTRVRSGTDQDLWAVHFINATHGIAVGANGTILKTTDGGFGWTSRSISSPNTFRSVTFTDAQTGTAVEDFGRVFRTTNGGDTWNQVSTTGVSGLCAVSFVSADIGTAVGYNGKILRTTDGGAQWNLQTSGTSQHLYAVFFFNAQRGIAVGTGGVIVRTTNGGSSWSQFNTGTFQPLYGVSFGDSLNGIAVGLPGMNFHTTDGGQSWQPRSSGTSEFLWKIHHLDENRVYAVGNHGSILGSSDGGNHWYTQTSGTTNSLLGVSFADVQRGLAVGDMGMILRTTNSGASWIQQFSGTTRTLWGVAFADQNTAYVVGNSGTILRTTNGGTLWQEQTSNTTVQLLGVAAVTPTIAMAVGNAGTILRTTNGGATWVDQPAGVNNGLNSVAMINPNIVTVVGSGGLILRTTNGGGSWIQQNSGTTQSLNGVSFVDANNGTVVGAGGTILRTTNGGAEWMPQVSTTTVVLTSVSFTSSTVGSAVGFGGMILRTTNGGLLWRRQASGTNNYLASIRFIDYNNGTTVGAGGTILKTTTGGDPPAPTFSPNTTAIGFGNVLVGESKMDSVIVSNLGTGTLHISQVVSDNSRFSVTPTSAIVPSGGTRTFTVTFTPISTGPRTGNIIFTTNSSVYPDSIAVNGNGFVDGLGRFLTISPDTIIKRDAFGKLVRPVKRGRGLPPTWGNLLSEVVVQGGFQPGATESDVAGGMVVGLSHMGLASPGKWKPFPDSAAVRCWVRLTRWNALQNTGYGYAFLQKTLADPTGYHTGPARGFDGTGVPGQPGRKPLVKQHTKLPPRKHSNALYAELVALKFNIASSQLGKTPVGFGELLYDRAGSPVNNLSVREIAERADSALTYWQGRPQVYFDSLYTAIYAINRAFLGPLDTLSFEVDKELILAGAIDLGSVSFLKPGVVPPVILHPTTDKTESPEDSDFGEEEFSDELSVPVVARVYQNYPNPFNPTTSIGFRLAESATATLKVYNVLGQAIRTLALDDELEEGYHIVEFDATGLPSGVYFYQLLLQLEDSGPMVLPVRKMVLMK